MNITVIIITTLLVLLLGWFAFLIAKLGYFKITKKIYTREYIAVIGVNAILTIGLVILSYVCSSQSIIYIFNCASHIIYDLLNLEGTVYQIPLKTPSWPEIFTAFFVLSIICKSIVKIVNSFGGPQTERQAEEVSLRTKPNIINDFFAYMTNDEKLRLKNPDEDKDKESKVTIFDQFEKLPWHTQVRELLILISKQYKIDEKDYYSEHNCFVSKYGTEVIGVLCVRKKPSNAERLDFINFVKSVTVGKQINKLIIAIQDDKKEIYTEKYENISIEYRFENELLSALVSSNLGDYRQFIKKKFENDEIIEGYSATLNDVYTSASAKILHRNQSKKDNYEEEVRNIEEYVSNWVNNRKELKQLAILGEYGQGKSVLAQRICYLILEKKIQTDRIPILVELRGKFPRQYRDKFELLAAWAAPYGIDPRALIKLHLAGKLLIIFDGFDEMDLVGDYNIRVDHFKKLWEFSSTNSKFIITGRPNFFLDDKELKGLLRTGKDHKSTSMFCEEIHLKPFSIQQIEKALRHTTHEIRDSIIRTIKSNGEISSFYDLISRPTHLFMASVVWNEKLSMHSSNINSALVYKQFLEYCYSRQDKKEIKTPLATYEREYFMQGIAVKMANSSVFTNQIEQIKLRDVILELYSKFPNEISDNQAVISTHSEALNTRFDKRYDEETVFQDIRSCGILVRDLSTHDSFKFSHKSFLEYLASDYCLFHIMKKKYDIKELNIEEISKNTLKNTLDVNANDIRMTPEIFKFIIQLLCNKVVFQPNQSAEDQAMTLFEMIYPYPRLSIKLALFLSPFMGLSKRRKIGVLILSCFFCFFSYQMWLLGWSSNFMLRLSVITTIVIFFIHRVFFKKTKLDEPSGVRELTLENGDTIYYIHNESLIHRLRRSISEKTGISIKDHDHLLLWYATCKEFKIPTKVMDTIMTEKRRKNYDNNILSYYGLIQIIKRTTRMSKSK